MMTFWETIFVAAIGGIVAKVLDPLFNYFLSRIEYKRQVYKTLVEKRITAYEDLLSLRGQVDTLFDYGKKKYSSLFDTASSFHKWESNMLNLLGAKAWLFNEEILKKARAFHEWYTAEMDRMRGERNTLQLDDEFFKTIGRKLYNEFREKYFEIYRLAEETLIREIHKLPKRKQSRRNEGQRKGTV